MGAIGWQCQEAGLVIDKPEEGTSLTAPTMFMDICAGPHLTHLASPPPLQFPRALMSTPSWDVG